MTNEEADRTCFVVMPYGQREVSLGDRKVTIDFDAIYEEIFVPAIESVPLAEGGTLTAHRTDRERYAALIDREMWRAIEYSRLALVDITGLNANVMMELGHRYRARPSGTVVVCQRGTPSAFDLNNVRWFPYEYEPADRAEASRAELREIVRETLERNVLDSPIQRALDLEEANARVEALKLDAANAVRQGDRVGAARHLAEAVAVEPANGLLRIELGLLQKELGHWPEAVEQFAAATDRMPSHGPAWRERGIAENKLFGKGKGDADGESSLRRAIELDEEDFDALASLGGVLKRAKRLEEARDAYRRSFDVSGGNSYPLLNHLVLEAHLAGKFELDAVRRMQLQRAAIQRAPQVQHDPPYDAPWSHFDLAQIRLFLGDVAEFHRLGGEAVAHCTARWQVDTFLDTRRLLVDGGVELDGLEDGIAKLEELRKALPEEK